MVWQLGCRPDDRRTIIWFPTGAEDSLIFCNIQTIYWAHLAFYHVHITVLFMVGIKQYVHVLT